MSETPSSSPPQPALPTVENVEKAEKAKKKKDKIRSAWISFVGRILAQVIGAAAAIGLGLMVLKHQTGAAAEANRGPDVPRAATPYVAPDARSLAVLPFQNFSGDVAADYLGDGITEAIITNLAQAPGLRVVSRTSSMPYKHGRKPLREIAEELGVRWVVEGSYIRSEGRIRVTAQLIDAKTDQHRWARSYDRTARGLLALQADVAAAIARDLGGAFAPEDER